MPEKIFHISVPVIKNVVIVAGGLVVGFISGHISVGGYE